MRTLGGFPLVFTAVFSSLAYSLPQGDHAHVLHEKRDVASAPWTRISDADGAMPLDLRIGLRQSNLHLADDYIREVSHPESDKYGQFWTPQQVMAAFAPSQEAVNSTVQWLLQMGVPSSRIAPSAGRNWINVKNSTVAEAEMLLHTTYGTYQDAAGSIVVACESYSVPASLQRHIDFVMPTIQFDLRTGSVTKLAKRDALSPKVKPITLASDPNSLDTCSTMTTPACLRAIYDIPATGEAVAGNSFGVVEFAPSTFNQTDLDGFFSVYTSNIPNGTAPVIDGIDGGFFSDEADIETRGESDLDLCYAMSLVYPQEVTLYQTGDLSFFSPATENNFLDAIDGSYCTFEGGDDPGIDAIYPHTASTGMYTGEPDCGTFAPTNVISISYQGNEADVPASYAARQCMEYMKLGLMGVTMVFPSADFGVAGAAGSCLPGPGVCPVRFCAGNVFNPVFPSSCPYVTSVGGSSLPQGGAVGDAQVAAFEFSPGGGFSNYFGIPDYQASAVATYYASHDPGYNSSIYNNTQVARGYPDLALSSQDYVTGILGGFQALSGTSAAAPTFAAMITLINAERIKAGKGPVGFINPVLYANPSIFDDIVVGSNPGCGADGFSAVTGWDPVSGLGAPNYTRLLDVFMSLP